MKVVAVAIYLAVFTLGHAANIFGGSAESPGGVVAKVGVDLAATAAVTFALLRAAHFAAHLHRGRRDTAAESAAEY